MAVTKNPLIRYKILDACFRNPFKKYTKELLLEKVNDDLYELTGEEKSCIKLRQLQDDIAFMKSAEGWSIELAEEFDGKKRIFRYEDLNFSINNAPLNEVELSEFQSAIHVLSQFEGMPQFEGIQEIIAKLKYDLKADNTKQPFIGFDTNQDLKRALAIANVPYTIVVKNQKIVYVHNGYSQGAEMELYNKLKELK